MNPEIHSKNANRNISTEKMPTSGDVIACLKKDGYAIDFNLLYAKEKNPNLFEGYKVDHIYRFEGESNPSDEEAVYAISDQKSYHKGIFVMSYGVYSDPKARKILAQLQMSDSRDQHLHSCEATTLS